MNGPNLGALLQGDYEPIEFDTAEFVSQICSFGETGTSKKVTLRKTDNLVKLVEEEGNRSTKIEKVAYDAIQGSLAAIIGELNDEGVFKNFDFGLHVLGIEDADGVNIGPGSKKNLTDLHKKILDGIHTQHNKEWSCAYAELDDIPDFQQIHAGGEGVIRVVQTDNSSKGWGFGNWTLSSVQKSATRAATNTFYNLVDANAPWKSQKYFLTMHSLVEFLKSQGVNLQNLHIGKESSEGYTPDQEEWLKKLAHTLEPFVHQNIDTYKPRSWGKHFKSYFYKISYRDSFHEFIDRFRAAWDSDSNEYNPGTKFHTVLKLIGWGLYYTNSLHTFGTQLVEQFILRGHKSLDRGDIINLAHGRIPLKTEIECIYNVSPADTMPAAHAVAGKAWGLVWSTDPIKDNGNLPYVLGTIKCAGGHEIQIIRQAVPSYGFRPTQGFQLSPEFEAATQRDVELGRKRLYATLAETVQKGRFAGDEKVFWDSSLFPHSKKYKENFRLIRFDHDSNFAHQRGDYEHDTMPVLTLKVDLLALLKVQEKGYYFPEDLRKNEAFEKTLEEIVEFVHIEMYQGVQDLKRKDRIVFIRFVHSFISLYLLLVVEKPHSFNFTCKNGRDRAMEEGCRFLHILGVILDKSEDQQFIIDVRTETHLAAIISNKGPMEKPRNIYAANSVEKLYQPESIAAIKKFYAEFIVKRGGLKLTDFTFPGSDDPNQQLWTDEKKE